MSLKAISELYPFPAGLSLEAYMAAYRFFEGGPRSYIVRVVDDTEDSMTPWVLEVRQCGMDVWYNLNTGERRFVPAPDRW